VYVGHWNLATDILHNPRNAERIPSSLYFLIFRLTNSFLNIITLKSHKDSNLKPKESFFICWVTREAVPLTRLHEYFFKFDSLFENDVYILVVGYI